MARWEPNARERLQQAAMRLFEERGYDRTTVGEIAERAQLTERTFFRYFADKREVLFSGSALFEKTILDAIAGASKGTGPLEVVVSAFGAMVPWFDEHRAHARKRKALIAAHAELRERELIKLASLRSAIGGSLRGRGLNKATADLVAEAGITVFTNAFERWVEDARKHGLSHHLQAALAELRVIAAGTGGAKLRAASER
jgi:AcrR family transcriptional regulator